MQTPYKFLLVSHDRNYGANVHKYLLDLKMDIDFYGNPSVKFDITFDNVRKYDAILLNSHGSSLVDMDKWSTVLALYVEAGYGMNNNIIFFALRSAELH